MTTNPPGAGCGGPGDAPFPSTRWSLVRRAADPGGKPARVALEALLRQYWRPVHAYVRAGRWASTSEEAEDLVQEFFAGILEKRTLARADEERGSFRGFLKATLRHFLLHEYERRRARKRGGGARVESPLPQEIPDPAAPPALEDVFDREWARVVLREALGDLERDLAAESKEAYYEVLKLRDLADEPPAYAELAARLGLTESDVRNYLHAARTRLKRLVRERVLETLDDPAELEAEVRRLFG